jgi:SAM-dependent methyltransferase
MRSTLLGPTVHERWEQIYRTSTNESFYEKVFDWLVPKIAFAGRGKVLDIGSGVGQHSIRLARRSFSVVAADFSPDRVEAATANIWEKRLQSRVTARLEDLEKGLSFPSCSFEAVLCWGALMHIPDNEKAMSELIRVTRLGGAIIIYETNLFSFYALATLIGIGAKRALRRSRVKSIRLGAYGLEYCCATGVGDLVIRQTRISAVVRFFTEHGCALRHRMAGQFTESYRFNVPGVRLLSHALNSFWFSVVRSPYLCCGNLLVFSREREASQPSHEVCC